MTTDEAARILIARILKREGGVSDIGDGAGITRYGQTPAWLIAFNLPLPKSPEDATANYLAWLHRTRLIALCADPDAFADITIDWAVNAGHGAALRGLQKALGQHVDGVLGPATQAAIDSCDRRAVALRVCAERVRFYGRLITDHPQKHAIWAHGWLNRIAAQIETI